MFRAIQGRIQLTACALMAMAMSAACQRVTPHAEATRQDSPEQRVQVENPSMPGLPERTARVGDGGAASTTSARSRADQGEAPGEVSATPAGADAGRAADSLLVLKRLSLASAVVDREPVLSEAFRVSEPAFAFLELANDGPGAGAVQVTFEHEGGTRVGFITLDVPPERTRWRTWAQTEQIRLPGKWAAIVSGADGEELGRASFEVN